MIISTFSVGPLHTNCYVVRDESTGAAAIIDPGEFTDELRAHVMSVGAENIKYILLTHCHFDHTLGVRDAKECTSAPVAIYKTDAPGLSDSFTAGLMSFGLGDHELPTADITFTDGEKFMLGDLCFEVMHTPGHTAGSCCYICGDVIFSGDTVFAGSCGRCDLPTGSGRDIVRSLRKLAALDGNYTIYPGHDIKTTLNDERMYNPYMR